MCIRDRAWRSGLAVGVPPTPALDCWSGGAGDGPFEGAHAGGEYAGDLPGLASAVVAKQEPATVVAADFVEAIGMLDPAREDAGDDQTVSADEEHMGLCLPASAGVGVDANVHDSKITMMPANMQVPGLDACAVRLSKRNITCSFWRSPHQETADEKNPCRRSASRARHRGFCRAGLRHPDLRWRTGHHAVRHLRP